MRKPTPLEELYAWHDAAIRGDNPSIHEGEPRCGWFKKRSAPRSKVWFPAEIYCSQILDENQELVEDEYLVCVVNGGRIQDVETEWLWIAKNPITRAEHEQLVAAMKELAHV